MLKPGGHFHHSDMLRPGNRVVERLYYAYLRFCLWFTGFLFRSGPAALNCKEYFIQALKMFYSARELSDMLEDLVAAAFNDAVRRAETLDELLAASLVVSAHCHEFGGASLLTAGSRAVRAARARSSRSRASE